LKLGLTPTNECKGKMRIPEKPARRVRDTLIVAIAAALLTSAGSIAAQQPTPRPLAPRAPAVRAPAESETPQSTTATYGDWVVQCQMQSGAPPKKICEMVQLAQVPGKNLPFSRVMIMQRSKGEPLKLVVQVPVNVSIAEKVRLQTTQSDSGMTAPLARCVPVGCFADFEINEASLKKLRAATGAGKLTFADAAGRDVGIPLSFKGFSASLDALMRP
jgi:invasion protein IalB